MIDYLEELAKGQCSRTHPRAVISALNLFETTGGVKAEDRIATNALVTSTVADLERELGMEALRPRRKASHYSVSIVAAFEDQVCNVKMPEYKRIYAWWKLVRVWGCMRYNDILHVDPKTITEDGDSVCFPLASTKTTGVGRRVEIIFANVSHKAWWLGTLLGTTFCRSRRPIFVVSAEGPPATTTPST